MKVSLKAMRVNAGLTQVLTAEKCGVSENTLLNWEAGKTTPRADKMKKLCEVLGCTIDDIQW